MAKNVIPIEELPVLDVSQKSKGPAYDFPNGVIIPVDKPLHFSSFDVVKYIRNRVPQKKVGHAGTLDPLATGLLLICCGRATKSVDQIHGLPKTYIATITFGASTPSFDAGTPVNETAGWSHITATDIEALLRERFTGKIMQVPPMYSALHKNGERLYRIARRGESVHLDPRPVEIYSVKIHDMRLPELTLEISCGKGTYIRSLVADLGREAGSLAFLSGLRRIKTGPFHVDHAWDPEAFNTWTRQNG